MKEGNDYMVLTNPSLSALQESVNEMMDKGYRPCGGVAVFEPPMSVGIAFAQAMVRYDETINEIKQ